MYFSEILKTARVCNDKITKTGPQILFTGNKDRPPEVPPEKSPEEISPIETPEEVPDAFPPEIEPEDESGIIPQKLPGDTPVKKPGDREANLIFALIMTGNDTSTYINREVL